MESTTSLNNNALVSALLGMPVITASKSSANFMISANEADVMNYAKRGIGGMLEDIGVITGSDTRSVPDDGVLMLSSTGLMATSTVANYNNDVSIPTSADGLGNYLYTPAAFSSGAYNIVTVNVDPAGRPQPNALLAAGMPPAIDAVIDDVPNIVGTVSNFGHTNDRLPMIRGSGGEVGGTVAVYIDGNYYGSAPVDSFGKWNYNVVAPLSDSEHVITTRNVDAVGNQSGWSAPYRITVDTIAPVRLQITDVWDDVGTITGSVLNGGVTNDARPEIKGTGAESNSTVIIYDGMTEIGRTTADSSGRWTFTPTADLSDSAHSITAKAVDLAGNMSVDSPARWFTVDTKGDTAPPQITAVWDDVAPATGVVVTGTKTDDRQPEIRGTTDANGMVNVYDGVAFLGRVTADSSGKWSYQFTSDLPLGSTHTFTAKKVDLAGNESPVSNAWTITIEIDPSVKPDFVEAYWGEAGRHSVPDGASVAGMTIGGYYKGFWSFQQSGRDVANPYHYNGQDVWQTPKFPDRDAADVMRYNGLGYKWLSAYPTFGTENGGYYSAFTYADFQRDNEEDMLLSPSADSLSRGAMLASYGPSDGLLINTQYVASGLKINIGAVIAFDKEGDGYLDALMADAGNANAIGFLNNTNGTLALANNTGRPTGIGSGYFLMGASGVDIDNDGLVNISGHFGAVGSQDFAIFKYDPGSKSYSQTTVSNIMTVQSASDATRPDTEARQTWGDFNGDGKMDLFLGRGAAFGGPGNSDESRIYYNDGAGSLSKTSVTRMGDNDAQTLSFAVDWNMDGKMDILETPRNMAGGAGHLKLWQNNGGGVFAGVDFGEYKGYPFTGVEVFDIDWNGSSDVLLYTANGGNGAYYFNKNVVADGTSMHLRILDQEGINCFFGNTVNLYNSHGILVGTQIINPQSNQSNDSTGIVHFYGLDPNETYSAQLVRASNGVANHVGDGHNYGGFTEGTVNSDWGGLHTGAAHDSYLLTAEANGVSVTSRQDGTGYNDHFFSSAGNDRFDGLEGWSVDYGSGSTWGYGGMDIVDYSRSTAAITAYLSQTSGSASGHGSDTLISIEGLIGSDFDDKFTGSSADNNFEGRGGNDTFSLSSGGHDALIYNLLKAGDPTGGNGSDTASGFTIGNVSSNTNADIIDLSGLFDTHLNLTGNAINEYIRVTKTGSNTVISVDLNGGGDSFATLLTLTNASATLDDLVRNHQLVV